ncbi:MAG: hypothetical protein ACRDGD_06490 [Candidatus Limnocylindria bacterium]
MSLTEFPGAEERVLAAALVARLPASAYHALRWSGIDLRSSAEHILYAALRQPFVPAIHDRLGIARPLARLARESGRVLRGAARQRSEAAAVAVFVTQPVHATLFASVSEHLPRGLSVRVVDARTRGRAAGLITSADEALAAHLDAHHVPSLTRHAISVQHDLSDAPVEWTEVVDRVRGERLAAILRRGLPLVALDAARVVTFVRRRRPAVIACFSESGLLARIVPTAGQAAQAGPRVVDLPHAEAADPSGMVGTEYDGVAVYGPHAASVMALAGVPADRIVEIGPLRYDALLSRPPTPPSRSPRRIVLASQPSDPAKPAFHPDVKRNVLRAAIAASAAMRPAELLIVPHPTESDGVTQGFLAQATIPDGVAIHLERTGTLHEALAGAWVLVTGASQAVFEAIVSGVPAITFNATGGPDPVNFARDGIALGAISVEEIHALALGLLEPGVREETVAAARAALGDRLGPLDGRAAARAADWIAGFVTERADQART